MKPASIVSLFLLSLIAPLMSGGCVSTPLSTPFGGAIVIVDAQSKSETYPCVNLGVVASTPFHVWQDPCRAPCSLFRVEGIQVLTKPGEEIQRAPYKSGEGMFYIERHETSSNIIFAPGFNPAAMGNGDFWADYRKLREQNRELEADFLTTEASVQRFRHDQKLFMIALIPLRVPRSDTRTNMIIIDRSMLAFLLGLDGVWVDLRRLNQEAENKKAVALVCRAIVDMSEAHQQKWPSFQWESDQKRVLDWCKKVAGK